MVGKTQICNTQRMNNWSKNEKAFRVICGDGPVVPCLITCEHASNELPEGWSWKDGDERLQNMHWAYDLGATEITEELVAACSAVGVLSNFSRLLIDANRDLTQENLFRTVADGLPVQLNQNLTRKEEERRIRGFWEPFHTEIDRISQGLKPRFLLSVHSYTPLYEGEPRDVQIGVLHDNRNPELASQWCKRLGELSGMDVRINEPYTGMDGYMYSASIHAERADCPTIEMEFRQDLLVDPETRGKLTQWMTIVVKETLDSLSGIISP